MSSQPASGIVRLRGLFELSKVLFRFGLGDAGAVDRGAFPVVHFR